MRKLLTAILLALAVAAHAGEPMHILPGLAVEKIPEPLTAPIPWPARTELIAAPGQLWLLAKGNVWRVGAASGAFATPLEVASFARSDAGTLAVLAGGKLGLVSSGMFLPAIATPEPEMRVAGGPGDTLYLYGTRSPSRIFRFDGEQVAVLATVPEPVTALTHVGETVIFVTAEGVFALRPGQAPGLIFPLAGHAPLISLAVNADTAELFGATEDAVYQIDEGRMTQIAQGLGGAVAVTGKDILVADPRRPGIFRLRPSTAQEADARPITRAP
ncbi:hypothetical protein [Propionivibrio limicola]|uniref:hypothetical protein n=1 Tax=Propionivibrio limicola TaxID=167645 RepID=UPI001292090A|nr:hypothetical protein [Propionivibrio limicola]